MSETVRVRYAQGCAVAEIGGQSLFVERRDTERRAERCPLEWVSLALGS